jgi:hypothetical protein
MFNIQTTLCGMSKEKSPSRDDYGRLRELKVNYYVHYYVLIIHRQLHAVHSFLFYSKAKWDLIHLVRRSLFDLLYRPRTIYDECWAVGGMRIGRGNWNTLRTASPVPICPPANSTGVERGPRPYEVSDSLPEPNSQLNSWRSTLITPFSAPTFPFRTFN